MRIAVYGTGAVGGYFGARLAQAGHDVWFIARGEHLRAIRAHGLAVESPRGDFVVRPANATDNPADVGPVDAVLLSVKRWQVGDACAAAAPMLGPGTAVVTLQNGGDAPEQAARVVGRHRALPGLARVFSKSPARTHSPHAAGAHDLRRVGRCAHRPRAGAPRGAVRYGRDGR